MPCKAIKMFDDYAYSLLIFQARSYHSLGKQLVCVPHNSDMRVKRRSIVIGLSFELLFMGVAMGVLTYWISMIFKNHILLPQYGYLIISGVVTATCLLLFNTYFVDEQKVVEVVSYLSTPAMICLVIPLYQHIVGLKKNGVVVVMGIFVGIVGSVSSVLLLWSLFSLIHEEYVCNFSRRVVLFLMSALSQNPGKMIMIISVMVMGIELFGYILIGSISRFICRIRDDFKGVGEEGFKLFATIVSCVIVVITSAFLFELL